MQYSRYLILLLLLFYAILKEKGVKLERIYISSEELIWSSFVFLIFMIVAEYFECDRRDKSLKFKLNLGLTLVCKFLHMLSIGYLVLYFSDIYTDDIYFSISMIMMLSCSYKAKDCKNYKENY